MRFVPIAMLIASGLDHAAVLDGGDGVGCGLDGASVVSLEPVEVPVQTEPQPMDLIVMWRKRLGIEPG